MTKEVSFWLANLSEDIIIAGFYSGAAYLIDRVFVLRSESNQDFTFKRNFSSEFYDLWEQSPMSSFLSPLYSRIKIVAKAASMYVCITPEPHSTPNLTKLPYSTCLSFYKLFIKNHKFFSF